MWLLASFLSCNNVCLRNNSFSSASDIIIASAKTVLSQSLSQKHTHTQGHSLLIRKLKLKSMLILKSTYNRRAWARFEEPIDLCNCSLQLELHLAFMPYNAGTIVSQSISVLRTWAAFFFLLKKSYIFSSGKKKKQDVTLFICTVFSVTSAEEKPLDS